MIDDGVLRNASAVSFRDRLMDCRFGEPARHGKWLILPTDGPTVLVHNGMTGRPVFIEAGDDSATTEFAFDRLIVYTDHGDVHYVDQRKLRGVWMLDSDTDLDTVTGQLGPDAWGLSLTQFRESLDVRGGALKTIPMNQQVIAGPGNMLSDEILWRARLCPTRIVTSLRDEDVSRLHRQLQRTLRRQSARARFPGPAAGSAHDATSTTRTVRAAARRWNGPEFADESVYGALAANPRWKADGALVPCGRTAVKR